MPEDVIQLRLSNLETNVKEVEATALAAKSVADRHESEINGARGINQELKRVWNELHDIRKDLKSLRNSAWGVAASIVGGSVLIVLQQGGHL